MSGGHFDYQQYRLHDIAEQIRELIASNDDQTRNQWGDKRGHGFRPETIAEFEVAIRYLQLAQIYAQRIDWLVSGDDGEGTFHDRLARDLQAVPGAETREMGDSA